MKIKKLNKKGQLFTLIAIALIGFLFVSYEVINYTEKRRSVETRVSTMEVFLDSIEDNLERQLYISGFRLIFLAESEITSNGNYIEDVDQFFAEGFFNGSINEEENEILFGATFADINETINDNAAKINVEITMEDVIFVVDQADPWNVRVRLISNFTMKDKSGLAMWDKEQEIIAYVPVEGFVDPVYYLNTNGKISQTINRTSYEGIYTNGNDVSNLLDHVNNNYYAANDHAPNFLQRLGGDLSTDLTGNGIESFVNSVKLSNEGIGVSDKTKIDYIYFSASDPVDYHVTGMPSWFTVDNEGVSAGHLEKYGVSDLSYL